MKNIKALIKNNILFIFTDFILLLSLIGIFNAIAALKKEQYDNPFLLFALVFPNVFWLFFIFFVPFHRKEAKTDEEIEARRIFYGLPPRKKATRFQEIIINIIIKSLIFISLTIILTCFLMMLFIAGKIEITHSSFFP